ncbi:hypothetical protein PSP6_810034 [Paraburkholderia tropica]|nr:hypothetical protein PSP6_810034 [Paraburkholderia tropica]
MIQFLMRFCIRISHPGKRPSKEKASQINDLRGFFMWRQS